MLIGERVALAVDFNLSIASFERDMQGVRHLVNFALSSPYINAATVMLVSPIGFSGVGNFLILRPQLLSAVLPRLQDLCPSSRNTTRRPRGSLWDRILREKD